MSEMRDRLKTTKEIEDELRELLKKSSYYNNSKLNYEEAKVSYTYFKIVEVQNKKQRYSVKEHKKYIIKQQK